MQSAMPIGISAHAIWEKESVSRAPCPSAKISLIIWTANRSPDITQQDRHEMNTAQDNITLENISSYGNAFIAQANAQRKKKKYKSITIFNEHLVENLHSLCQKFADASYRTGGYTLCKINDSGKERDIAKVAYKDRVAQWMIANYYQPYLLEIFHPNSHAAIPGKGDHTALAQIEYFVRDKGYTECLKLDITKYFYNVNRAVLKSQIESDIPDERVVHITRNIVDDAPGDIGIPIGNYMSQPLANRYLTPFDYWLGEKFDFVRYMDDVIVFSNSREELLKLYREIEWYLKKELYLSVKHNWQVFRIEDRGIDFVGYRVWKDETILRKRVFANMRKKCMAILKKVKRGDFFTDSMRSTVMSFLGWVKFCTERTRKFLFGKYIQQILRLTNTKLKRKSTREAFYGNCRLRKQTA